MIPSAFGRGKGLTPASVFVKMSKFFSGNRPQRTRRSRRGMSRQLHTVMLALQENVERVSDFITQVIDLIDNSELAAQFLSNCGFPTRRVSVRKHGYSGTV